MASTSHPDRLEPEPGRPEATASANPLLDGIGAATRPTGPILAVVVAFVLLIAGGVIALPAFLLLDPADGSFLAILTMLGGFAPTLLLMFAWVRWKEGRAPRTLGFQVRGGRAGRSVAIGAALALAAFSAAVLFNVVTGQMRFVARDGEWLRWSQLLPVLVLLAAFLVQGSTEEILTRGYIMQAVNRKWGLAAAVIAQVVFFVGLHLANTGALHVLPILNLALFSVAMAFWAVAEGGLWAVCAFHGVWNWTQGNLFGIPVSGEKLDNTLLTTEPVAGAETLLTGGAFGIEGSIATTVMLAIGVVLAFLAYRRRTGRDRS